MIGFKKWGKNHLEFHTQTGHRGHFTDTQEWSKDRLLFLFSIEPVVPSGAFLCSWSVQFPTEAQSVQSPCELFQHWWLQAAGDAHVHLVRREVLFPWVTGLPLMTVLLLYGNWSPSYKDTNPAFFSLQGSLCEHIYRDLLFRSSWKLLLWKSSCN